MAGESELTTAELDAVFDPTSYLGSAGALVDRALARYVAEQEGSMSESRDEIHARGMEVRRAVLGDDHVDRAIERTTPFTEDFQDLITRYAWGEIWSRPGLDRRTRSCITLTALVATGREHELAMHVRAARRNGLTPDEIGEVLLQCAVYCGVPAANGAFAIAQRVLDERGALSRAVILSAVRTPVGRYGGGLADVRPDDLAAVAVAAAVERAGVPPAEIEDVWLGCANQAGEDNRNVARFAALLAGLPDSVAGVTVNRLCASGLSAVVGACHAVIAGDGDLFVAGGVESMTRAPLVTAKPDAPYARGEPDALRHDARLALRQPALRGAVLDASRWARRARTSPSGGACRARIRTRSRCARSSGGRRPHAAGRFADELVPAGELERDEHPRPDTTAEKLGDAEARLPARGGTVTAGNASGINDGAAALVIASEERARVARRRAARSVRRLGGRRRRPRGDGDRPGARRPQAARAHGRRRRRTSTSSS